MECPRCFQLIHELTTIDYFKILTSGWCEKCYDEVDIMMADYEPQHWPEYHLRKTFCNETKQDNSLTILFYQNHHSKFKGEEHCTRICLQNIDINLEARKRSTATDQSTEENTPAQVTNMATTSMLSRKEMEASLAENTPRALTENTKSEHPHAKRGLHIDAEEEEHPQNSKSCKYES